MLRPIRHCHSNTNLITHFKIHTHIHPKLWPMISYSLSFTLLPIFYILTFQINSLLHWSFGICSCPALLLCRLLDIVSNTLLVLLLLQMTLLLGPQPVWAVTQIIMRSWVCFGWFECLVGVNIRNLGKLIAPLRCGVPMRHDSAPYNPSILSNLHTTTMCWHGIPSFFGNPHVHFPNLDPNVVLFGRFTLYSLWLVDFLLTIAVCSFFSVKWTLKSCTLKLLNASSINSIPFGGNSTCSWFHARLFCLSYRVLSFLSKIRVALKMSTAVFWWMSSFALFIVSTPEDALLPYMQTELPWTHFEAGNCISSAMLKR